MSRQLLQAPPRPVEAARAARVRGIMTPDPITIGPDTGLEQVIDLFAARALSHVPVVDDAGHPIGMISKTDIVREVHLRGDTQVDQSPGHRARGARTVPAGHVHEVDDRARDVMTPLAVWVPETASIAEAAHVIASGQLHAVVVTGHDGRIVGIVSAVDIAAWVAGVERRRESTSAH